MQQTNQTSALFESLLFDLKMNSEVWLAKQLETNRQNRKKQEKKEQEEGETAWERYRKNLSKILIYKLCFLNYLN